MMGNFITVLEALLIWLIGLPVILGTVAVIISRSNKAMVVALDGFRAQVVFGCLGIVIHECSHLLIALLFGYRIDKISLIRMPDPDNPHDNSLGYVSHSWNDRNYYQRAGNLFIGIAPVIGCSLAMAVATRYLATPVYDAWQSLAGFGSPVASTSSWWQWLLWLIIMVNISIGGFDLSKADLQNSRHGLLMGALVLLLLTGVLSFSKNVSDLTYRIQAFMLPVYACLGLAIGCNILVWIFLPGRMRRRV